MKIIINNQYSNIKEWVEKLPQTFDNIGEIVYQARNTLKKMQLPNGEEVVVKKYAIPIFINKIAYQFFRKCKARRAYENAEKLLSLGIPTPKPVFYITIKKYGLFHQGYFGCINNPTKNIMREFVDRVNGGEDVLKQFAAFTKMVHDKKILHIDYSPGNIIYEKGEDGVARFSLLDLNRMRFDKELTRKERLYNFRRMFRCKESLAILVGEYARLCDWNEEEAIKEAIEYSNLFWEKTDKRNEYKQRRNERRKK